MDHAHKQQIISSCAIKRFWSVSADLADLANGLIADVGKMWGISIKFKLFCKKSKVTCGEFKVLFINSALPWLTLMMLTDLMESINIK